MTKCPNCYSDRISLTGERGDGKCDVCYGTGKEQSLGSVLSDITGIRGNDCSNAMERVNAKPVAELAKRKPAFQTTGTLA